MTNNSNSSAAGFSSLLSAPPYVSVAWEPFSAHVIDGPLHMETVFEDHVLGLHLSGNHRVRQEVMGRACEDESRPGRIAIVPAHHDFRNDATAPARFITLLVPDAYLARVIAEHWEADPAKVEIVWRPFLRDRLVESVMISLAAEARNQSPSGRLYAESACEFLARLLVHRYSSMSLPAPRSFGGLPANRLKIVREFIESNLTHSLSLRELAELAGVGTRHFERAFRQSTGESPHAYVLRARLTAAKDLLISHDHLSIDEISERVGFSSASHLAQAFRKHTGLSPSEFRKVGFG